MSKIRVVRIAVSLCTIIVFLSIHIAFYWIVYNHSPFELDYFKIYMSGFFEIYLFVALILIIGIMINAKYFCSLFFIFAVYGQVQMLFGYWKLGAHPTMGPAMMQFMLYITGFILGIIVEIVGRTVNATAKKRKLS